MKIVYLAIIVAFLGWSCTKEISNNNGWVSAKNYADTLKAVDAQIFSTLQQYYLWYNYLPAKSPSISLGPQSFLDTCAYKTLDKWSFIMTQDEYMTEFVTGIYYGHGFAYKFDGNKKMRIIYVFKNSDMYAAGVMRGWIINSVNSTKPDSVNASKIFGPSELGYQNTINFTRLDGKDTTIAFAKQAITQNTVLAYDTLHVNNSIVGYISLLSFTLDADTALKVAMNYLMNVNATELVLDLRYNGGGSLNIAQDLADMIAGQKANNQTFVTLAYNTKNTQYNETWKFSAPSIYLNLKRLFVITTGSTASASEAVINGLKPFIDVYLVGSTTDGKPVGMLPFVLDYNYHLYPIMFKTTNKKGEGDYFSGFAPDKAEIDDVTHSFGDRREACLSQALYYIQNGTWNASAKSAIGEQKIFYEKQPLNFMYSNTNNFIK